MLKTLMEMTNTFIKFDIKITSQPFLRNRKILENHFFDSCRVNTIIV